MNYCGEQTIHLPESTCSDCSALEHQVAQIKAALASVEQQLAQKQNELIAGENIKIENDVISATGSGG